MDELRDFAFDTSDIADAAGASALVTGGVGFIGSRLCELLDASGWTVHSASRRADVRGAGRHWQVDLADYEAVTALMGDIQPDYVFHLASHVWGAPDLAHVLPAFRSNLQTTVNLLAALAERACRRFVVTGSLVEPDARSSGGVPNSPYAASKWATSDYVRMFHALYGFPAAIARVFMVYGPAQQDPTKLVPYVIRSVLRGERPKITSGRHEIDWVYVDDVAYGLARVALTGGLDGETVDLGSGSLVSTGDFVEEICELMGGAVRPVLGALPDRPLEPKRIARVEETRRLLGWAPETPREEGLGQTIQWFAAEADGAVRSGREGLSA
jgi:nucleoside-diphosphate-sugar epimerase